MKTRILAICSVVVLLNITGCQKQSEEAQSPESEKATSSATAQFNQSDSVISKYLDQLDSPDTPKQTSTQILCHDYPTEYKKNYIPALLQLAPKDNSPEKLLKDLEIALDYYKDKLHVECATAH